MCQPVLQYKKASKCMEDDESSKRLPYLMDGHWVENNQYRWVMSKTLPANGFQGIKTHLNLMSIL